MTFCDNYDCPLSCKRHPKRIPKKQKTATFANLAGVCKPYLTWLVKKVQEKTTNETDR